MKDDVEKVVKMKENGWLVQGTPRDAKIQFMLDRKQWSCRHISGYEVHMVLFSITQVMDT